MANGKLLAFAFSVKKLLRMVTKMKLGNATLLSNEN